MARKKQASVPMRTVPCDGAAHSNPHIDHCMVCLGGTWGELQIPAAFPDLRTYHTAMEIMAASAYQWTAARDDGHRSPREVSDLNTTIGVLWDVLSPEQRADAWERLAHLRKR